jgi:DNA helicase HerA-like ATPase
MSTKDEIVAAVNAGYAFDGPVLDMGALVVDGEPVADTQVRIPIAMLNRHGLVAGATGTGKTRTLQVMAEQLSANGVPVFLADIKGDLTGLVAPGEGSEKLIERTAAIGQQWAPAAFPVEFYALGGQGNGIPVRATITGFGPILLSKILGLNDVQESSLGLVFMFADQNGLPLLDLKDLRSVIQYLVSDEGKAQLAALGGLSKATAGVLLRQLLTFESQGADAFFGEPEFDTADLLRVAADGRGIISCLELPALQGRPELFSTFLMWLLAELFQTLPEVGDLDKPKLVFFFDEAHLLFNGASKSFMQSIVQTVRLIRSKGVGIFFVTQTPKDVPSDVLGQLGSRVQHALRAFTPDDAKALKATVGTYPKSGYDLSEVLTSMAIGEAVVTVLSDKGIPTPVAWTRLRAPQALMAEANPAVVQQTVTMSPLYAKYAFAIDRESAYEMLAARVAQAEAARAAQEQLDALAKAAAAPPVPTQRASAQRTTAAAPRASAPRTTSTRRTTQKEPDTLMEQILGSTAMKGFAQSFGKEISRSIFGTGRRR